jgi:hypothetical protein
MSKSKTTLRGASSAARRGGFIYACRGRLSTCEGDLSGNFFRAAEEDEAARRVRSANRLVWRQARRVGASLITGHDLKGAAEST